MRIYLDICCLKRPFDDQSQTRIALETTSIMAILRAWSDGRVSLLRSTAHDVENERNSNPERAAAVRRLLGQFAPRETTPSSIRERASDLQAAGFTPYDALHLAWAEHQNADAFVTVDDDLLRKASRENLRTRLMKPEACAQEIERWAP